MGKQATGHVRWFNGLAVARIRVTRNARESFALPTCTTEADAAERARLLADVAKRMRRADVQVDKARTLLEKIAGASPRSLRNALDVAGELIGGELRPQGAARMPTFGELGDQWTKGELAQRYPDQIRTKRTADEDIGRLKRYVLPVLGDVPIDRVTLELCEEVMRRIPTDLAVPTRRNIGHMMVKVMRMAVYPLRLIERSPIPPNFLPSQIKRKALAYLYPNEDARLMACRAVPLCYRMLWGFLAREGMREGEALALTWADLDLERGAVRLDRNKTDDPRAWALNPGVTAALIAYRDRFRKGAQPGDRVFVGVKARPLISYGLADLLRAHLRLIKLDDERPELFQTTAERQRIRVHDLRATFVTLGLANGRTEAWISDRTGHRSSAMINRYRRAARTFAELQAGELVPLYEAISELSDSAIGPGLGHDPANSAKPLATPTRFELVLPA